MIDIHSDKEKLHADREAVVIASRPPSFFSRLFGKVPADKFGPKVQFENSLYPVSEQATAPIMAMEELSDNGMLIESLIEVFADQLGLNPYDLITHGYLDTVREESSRVLIKRFDSLDEHQGSIGVEDLQQMSSWFQTDQLPKTFRRELVEYIIVVDDLHDTIANLSQTRWERLRTWTCANG